MSAALTSKEQYNAGLQLRRAISIQAGGRSYLRTMLSRRQLQGFVMCGARLTTGSDLIY
jgi:hypothetical protein